MSQGRALTDEQIDYIRHNFSDKTKYELAKEVGVSTSTVDRIQSRYHLRKSPEHLHNMGVRAGKASQEARGGKFIGNQTPEAIEKRIKSYKARYQIEDMRARWGLHQLTKMRLKHGCKQQQDQRSYLKMLGYIIDSVNYVAYYTETTHRATRLERLGRGGKKGPMRCYYDFKPYDG